MKVMYVGDTAILVEIELKGFTTDILSPPHRVQNELVNALTQDPEISVRRIQTHDAISYFPKTAGEMREYDVIILSDVGSDALLLYPTLFDFGKILGPNRLESLKEYVQKGGGFMMIGGYASFHGRYGVGNFDRTSVNEILPVSILPYDDRVEVPEGCRFEVVDATHPIMAGIPWKEDFFFLGYNELKLKEGATLLAKRGEHPFIAVWDYGKGRTMAFASDCSYHWGGSFVTWKHYPKFWIQAVRWLCKRI